MNNHALWSPNQQQLFVTMHRKNIFHVVTVTLPPKFPGKYSTCCCIPRHLVCSPQTSPENREYRVKNINIDIKVLHVDTSGTRQKENIVRCYDIVAMLYRITLKTEDIIETRHASIYSWLMVDCISPQVLCHFSIFRPFLSIVFC